MADSEDEPEGAPGAEEDARTGLIDAYSDDDDERDEVISVTATIIDGDMSAEDGNDGSDDDDPDAEACPWSYLDLRRDFYAEVRLRPSPRLFPDPPSTRARPSPRVNVPPPRKCPPRVNVPPSKLPLTVNPIVPFVSQPTQGAWPRL